MGLKRKRSGASFDSSSGFSSSGSSSPAPFFGGSSDAMDAESPAGDFYSAFNFGHSVTYEAEALHLNSRTRKRFRDNRPDEQAIHENTFQKLYQAQRHDFQAPTPATPRPATASSTSSQKQRAQASLHSFWTLPSRPSTSTTETAPTTLDLTSLDRRRESDSWAGGDSAMGDSDMEVDGWGTPNCIACGGIVCTMCSVAAGSGDARKCLPCRTRPGQRVGGLDWAAASALGGALSCSGCGGSLSFLSRGF